MKTEAPVHPPEGFCPKCVAERPVGPEACARCGLRFSRWKKANVELPEWLWALWKDVWSDWKNQALHAQLWKRAGHEGELASVARLYRVALAWKPGDEGALRGMDEISRRAVSAFQSTASSPQGRPGPERFRKAVTVGVGLGMVGLSTWFFLKWVGRP